MSITGGEAVAASETRVYRFYAYRGDPRPKMLGAASVEQVGYRVFIPFILLLCRVEEEQIREAKE